MQKISAMSRRRLLSATGMALFFNAPVLAQSQAFPTKPVKLVVPFAPGGPTDIVARLIGQKLSEQMGQTFIIDNKPGAGGQLGADMVMRSAPDGYTLLIATTAHASYPSLNKNVGVSLSKDLTPVALLTSGPLVIVTDPHLPVKNLSQLIALAKSKPGEISFASNGNGTTTHLAAELFSSMTGVKMNHIPYKGSAPALTDVMGGQTNLMFDTMLSAMPHVRSGKLQALAVTSAARAPVAPELPTVAESGFPDYEAISWNGLLGPVGLPAEVSSRLSAELKKVLALPDVKTKLEAQGSVAAWMPPEDFRRFIGVEVQKWANVIKTSGAKAD